MNRQPGLLLHVVVATAVVLIAAVVLRFATGAAQQAPTWDEPVMQPIVETIVSEGWTVEHAIDYDDTKGPVFFWIYALLGEMVGSAVSSLRLISLLMFTITGPVLGWLGYRCGYRPATTAAVAAMWVLLPYNAVLGQLFMSETSFLLGAALLMQVFLWGMGAEKGQPARILAPVVFAALLSVMLHHRPHAVAYAGAAVLVATERQRRESWPWWVASLAAGLSRLPLYFRWDGLVGPSYQAQLGLGLRLDSLTYLAISGLPCTVGFLWVIATDRNIARRWWWLAGGAAIGLLLGALAVPDLALDAQDGKARYLGMIATTLRPLGSGVLFRFAVALLAMLGTAALAAMLACALKDRLDSPRIVLQRAAAWSVLVGWAMYSLTGGVVFDRYLIAFMAIVPFLWIGCLPRWLLVLQAIGLAGLVLKLAAGLFM